MNSEVMKLKKTALVMISPEYTDSVEVEWFEQIAAIVARLPAHLRRDRRRRTVG